MADAPIICAAVAHLESIEVPVTCVLILTSDPAMRDKKWHEVVNGKIDLSHLTPAEISDEMKEDIRIAFVVGADWTRAKIENNVAEQPKVRALSKELGL
jgi:hypothetical protein